MFSNFHKVLEKQINKFLEPHHLEDESLRQFLETVNRSYSTFEKDKKMSDHAFIVSEREYQEVTKRLESQNDIKTQSIQKLKNAIHALDPSTVFTDQDFSHDLINIISFLEFQIGKAKELEALLINAKESAEKAAKIKSEFLSVMSHEIRTPLNAIIGNIHLLKQGELMPSQAENLRILQIAADNLLNLINDILDFNKIEEGKIEFSLKDINIRALVNNIKLANSFRAEERGCKIKVLFDEEIPEMIKGDDVRLSQILNNLISNAVKFTKNGKITIEVQLALMGTEELDLSFSVRDTGIGISRDKQEAIFERFTQAHSDITRQFGGSGLGLTIIKKLLNLQGSEIYVTSEEGKGSNFYFNLKFGKSDQKSFSEDEKLEERIMDLQGVRVLLVEDVHFNIMVAEQMLQNWNAIVDVAENGLSGLGKARENEYDIILMDLQMPVMDGYTAAKAIRSFNSQIPIIALTASATADIQVRAKDMGMSDYVSKPFNPRDLFNVIQKYTFQKRA